MSELNVFPADSGVDGALDDLHVFLHASILVFHDADNGAVVVVLIAVARSAEESEQKTVGKVLVAVLYAFVSPNN